MPVIQPTELESLERAPASPAALTHRLWEVINNSVVAKAKLDSVNWETGEYRVVLQGTLDLGEAKFETP